MDEDTLVYDLDTYRAVSLNRSAETVRRLCDGSRDVSAVATDAGVSEKDVAKVLRDLDRSGLLEPGFDAVALLSRRNFLGSAGTGAAASVPMVLAMTLPSAAQAASCLQLGATCQPGSNDACCPGLNCQQQMGVKTCQPV